MSEARASYTEQTHLHSGSCEPASGLAPTIPDAFLRMSKHSPDSIAIEQGTESLSYSELERLVSTLAAGLVDRGLRPQQVVAVLMPRSPALIATALAIMSVGCVYLPLDPSYPKDRLAYMCEISEIKMLVTDAHLAALISAAQLAVRFEDLMSPRSDVERPRDTRAELARHYAYLMFTSGSTGRPKGVLIRHESAVEYFYYLRALYGLDEGDRVLQLPPISFDPSIRDLLGPVCCGATVVLPPAGVMTGPEYIAEALQTVRPTAIISGMPSIMSKVIDILEEKRRRPSADLRLLCLSGEVFTSELLLKVRRAVGTRCRIINHYGPTETTMTCAYFDATNWNPDGRKRVPIGTPLPNARFSLLPVSAPDAVTMSEGELVIEGRGLADGYIAMPGQTARAFVPSREWPGSRMYRTGDLAELTKDGLFECVGRIDSQVKVHGVRIELEEIEEVLRSSGLVEEVAVAQTVSAAGKPRLVAFAVFKPQADSQAVSQLRALAGARLPPVAVPLQILAIPATPRLPNGKIDRERLAAFARSTHSQDADAPTGLPVSISERLRRIWEAVLDVTGVGPGENFFEAGGHSLSALRLLDEVEEEFGISLSMRILLGAPTIESFAAAIVQLGGE